MLRILLSYCVLVTSLIVPAQAEGNNVGAYLTFATDYRFRGISQTDESPAVQAGLDFQHDSGFFAGLWGSNVEFARERRIRENPRTIELDTYVGYTWQFDQKWAGVLSVVRYNYPDSSFNYDYNEVAFGVSYKEMLSLTLSLSNDLMAHGETAINYELGIQYPLGHQLELGTVLGFFDAEDALGENYVYGSVGISKLWRDLVLDLRFHDTDGDAERIFGDYAGSQLVLSLSVSLR